MFLSCLKEEFLFLVFMDLDPFVFAPSIVHIYHYYFFCQPSPFKQKHTLRRYALLSTIFLHLFLYRIYWLPLLLYLLWPSHTHCFFSCSSFSFNLNIWTLPLVMSYSPTSETFYLFYCLLFSYLHLLFHSTLHHPVCYYFKFILENQFPFCLPFLIPTVTG